MESKLISFAERTNLLDVNDKLKLLLFACGVKPSTYVHVRVSPQEVHSRTVLNYLLKNTPHNVSRAKGFEEIVNVSDRAVVWNFTGIWFGYDLFRDLEMQNLFAEYLELVKLGKHGAADKLAGRLYGYPSCCIESFHLDPERLKRRYSYRRYYEFLSKAKLAFPFIQHIPCSLSCKRSASLNDMFAVVIRSRAPLFYKDFITKKSFDISFVVDSENDILVNGKSIWQVKDAHEYVVITTVPVDGKFLIFNWLCSEKFEKGTVIKAKLSLKYNIPVVESYKKSGVMRGLHHERHFKR